MSPYGHGVQVRAKDVGALFDQNGPNCSPGHHPTIGVMIKVVNADATVEKIRSLGGKAGPVGNIENNGRMAMCHDPNGGASEIWEPTTVPGTDN